MSDEDLPEVLLRDVLHRARDYGYLGPGPIEPHIDHARGFVAALADAGFGPPSRFCDLGTGGGVPGLVLALTWPEAQGLLIESNQRRAASLREAVLQLDIGDRVHVAEGRGETFARDPEVREQFAVVTARSFGEPAVTAEIGAGFARIGGALVVSEPPEPRSERWPAERLAELGFGAARRWSGSVGNFVVLPKISSAPPAMPRAIGKPAKRPLW